MSVSGSLMRQIKYLEKHHTKAKVKCEWKTEVNLAKKKVLIQVTPFLTTNCQKREKCEQATTSAISHQAFNWSKSMIIGNLS
jgi:hypothetical protein